MTAAATEIRKSTPFDSDLLDKLMEDSGIDVLVATSKHNIQYLLGGYRFFFYENMHAIGISRYLPALVYRKGKPEQAAYIGCTMENWEQELGKFWPQNLQFGTVGSIATAEQVLKHVRGFGDGIRRIGVETAFIPADAAEVLRRGLSNVDFADAVVALERLRARKTLQEIDHIRQASERVVESMLATFATCEPGMTKNEVVETLRREEVSRGLTFDYCLITFGNSVNRAPSEQRLAKGDTISLDSGGNYKGYIGDLCRMGVLGETDPELAELLAFVDDVQQAARKPIRAGALGREIIVAGETCVQESKHRDYTDFMAHGMGLVTHEAPRLMTLPRLSYDGYDGDRPLESGMVVSIETTMHHPKRGFVKLEDTVLVTETGYAGMGDSGRGWNRAGR